MLAATIFMLSVYNFDSLKHVCELFLLELLAQIAKVIETRLYNFADLNYLFSPPFLSRGNVMAATTAL